ncbi:MAG: hypothetical protein ABSG76_27395 [Xanthobacteraceae bacterium]
MVAFIFDFVHPLKCVTTPMRSAGAEPGRRNTLAGRPGLPVEERASAARTGFNPGLTAVRDLGVLEKGFWHVDAPR